MAVTAAGLGGFHFSTFEQCCQKQNSTIASETELLFELANLRLVFNFKFNEGCLSFKQNLSRKLKQISVSGRICRKFFPTLHPKVDLQDFLPKQKFHLTLYFAFNFNVLEYDDEVRANWQSQECDRKINGCVSEKLLPALKCHFIRR